MLVVRRKKMKRLALVLVLVLIAATGLVAQIPDITTFQNTIQGFANSVANALPLESSVGLNWSDANIGQFPKFGIGFTVGAATIPYSDIENVITKFGGTIPSNLSFLSSIGIPVPAYTVDVRMGGFILPFDIGLKFGYIPPNSFSLSNVSADYLLIGGDVRYAVLKDNGTSPGLSVGIGYTYMKGNVSIPGVLGSNTTINSVYIGDGTYNLVFSDPSLNFFWTTSVIDAKVQLSKTLFIITPYIGLGASYGISNAGGGMLSTVYRTSVAPGNELNPGEISYINSHYGTNYTSANQTFGVSASANGFSTRVFGGFSFNLFVLKIGLGAEYEFLSGSFAAMANARIQL